jgi:hypothetical protein
MSFESPMAAITLFVVDADVQTSPTSTRASVMTG